MSTLDHVATLFEDLVQQLNTQHIQKPQQGVKFHQDASLLHALSNPDYYQQQILRVVSVAELLTVAANSAVRARGYQAQGQDEFVTLHRALLTAQLKLSSALSIAGAELVRIKDCPTHNLNHSAARAVQDIFVNAVHGRAYLDQLVEILTIWATSIKALCSHSNLHRYHKALRSYFDDIVTTTAVLCNLTHTPFSQPRATAPQVTQAQSAPSSAPLYNTQRDHVDYFDWSEHQTFTQVIKVNNAAAATGKINIKAHSAQPVVEADIRYQFSDKKVPVQDNILFSFSELDESHGGAIALNTAQKDVNDAVFWLLGNESGIVWSSTLMTYFDLLNAAAEKLQQSNGKFKAATRDMRQTAQRIENILVNDIKQVLNDIGLWDEAPQGANNRRIATKYKRILVEINPDKALLNLLDALTEQGADGFISCFSKVLFALANAHDEVKKGALLDTLDDKERKKVVALLAHLSLAIGKELDKLSKQMSTEQPDQATESK
ncbi:hypothetical protein [Pseudoalteromonas umbrosa]|uniref:hypothetical protein n=1 Tax=Pseudoalteromonas umbrosa TaxID=3048489 RepID=UPI0024C3EFDD|nr:hypothetical protein [Pseudoalteromonas sp. B95]MDK1290184.1 hypothetical protein [Pseudoalteromonas sp. B95]